MERDSTQMMLGGESLINLLLPRASKLHGQACAISPQTPVL